MKLFILSVILLFMLSCSRVTVAYSDSYTTIKGNPVLLGKIARSDLNRPPFNQWFESQYAGYKPDSATIAMLKTHSGLYTYEIFLGTWCGDSRREVPRLLRILDELEIHPSRISIIALGNSDSLYKQSPQHEERGKAITRVPHLNVYRKGKEKGRITETPVESWEKDLLTIISGRPYRPKYPDTRVAVIQGK